MLSILVVCLVLCSKVVDATSSDGVSVKSTAIKHVLHYKMVFSG